MPALSPSRPPRSLLAGVIVFLLAATLSGAIVWQLEQHAIERERVRVAHLAGDHAHAIEHTIEHALSATHALAALVRQGNGAVSDFETAAGKMLPFYPGVSELALAPGGVIRDVAPMAGNERAVGLDLLASPAQRKESLNARDSGRLTLAGPLELVQGGTGVVGRLPVFLEDGSGRPVFWGFALVVMRLPGGLDMAHLSGLDHQSLAYELWRVHPDNGKKQIIARSSPASLVEPVEQALHVPNATWTLSVAPVRGWAHPLEIWTRLALGILVSLLLGYLARIVFELRAQKQLLEARVAQRTADILAAQRQLKSTLNALPDLVWLKDADGVYLSCNPVFERFFGASEADIVGKTDYDFVDREQADFFREHDRAAMAAGTPSINEEWLSFADDGSRRLFETIKTPMLDDDGKPVGVLGVARDITKRAQAEQALLQSRQQAQQYLNIAGVMLVALDAEGRVQLVNLKGCDMLGAPEAEILGKDWIGHFLPERVRQDVRENVARMMKGDIAPVEYMENAILTRKGEERMVAWHNVLLRDESGRITGVLASGEDITERKLAEQALRDSRESLRLLLDSMAEAAYGVDFDGNCTFANRAFLKMLGYQNEDEVLDKRIHALIHHSRADGSAYPESECSIHRAYLSNQAMNVSDEVFWRKDGVAIPVEYWSNPIVTDGVVVGAIATFIDITKRQQAEAQLALAAKVFEQSGEGILITDAQGTIIMVNQAFTAITGYSEAEALGQTPAHAGFGAPRSGLLPRDVGMPFPRRGAGRARYGIAARTAGCIRNCSRSSGCSMRRVRSATTSAFQATSPSTRRRRRISSSWRISTRSPGCRTAPCSATASVTHSVLPSATTSQLAVMFVDLDHFKNVNDSLGHRIGDELLIEVANRLKAAVREEDTVSRLGGDEFILVLPDTDADGAAHVAGKLLEAVAQPYQIEGFELTVTPVDRHRPVSRRRRGFRHALQMRRRRHVPGQA